MKMAAKYAEATAHLNEMLPKPIKCMHIIGGGSQNKLLNRLTSEALGVPVIAGPIEATGMDNIRPSFLPDRRGMRRRHRVLIPAVRLPCMRSGG